MNGASVPTRGGTAWRRTWGFLFRGVPTPAMRVLRARDLAPLEELVVVGRRSGRVRRVLLSAFERDGQWYIGHPTSPEASWGLNLEAAGSATLDTRRDGPVSVTAVRLEAGPERDMVIDEVVRRQPQPMRTIYRAARGHMRDHGSYYRLTPTQTSSHPSR